MAPTRVLDVDLPADVFAIVMATGIVSVAADDHHYRLIDSVLAVIASAVFVVLAVGLGLKIVARRDVLIAESRDPDTALRMFTFVAAACVLGVVWRADRVALWILAVLAAIGWLVLMPLAIRDVRSRPHAELRDHARGAWLLVSVATSGLATTAADFGIAGRRSAMVWLAVLLWVLAVVLYVAVTWLIARRALSAPLRPDAVTPDSWILMGAMAIVTLAGDHILRAARAFAPLHPLAIVAAPVTFAAWVVASLWIPFLLYAAIWRIDQHSGSLRFAGAWWSAVFPLGMYASATAATGTDLGIPSLEMVSLVMFWIALVVWLIVAVGLLRKGLARIRAPHV